MLHIVPTKYAMLFIVIVNASSLCINNDEFCLLGVLSVVLLVA